MAEAFSRRYGSDVMVAQSAGLAPALLISAQTLSVMAEKNITLDRQFPKALSDIYPAEFDLVVNMSGFDLPPGLAAPVHNWNVRDPIGAKDDVFRTVRDQIEMMVMSLILSLRRERRALPRRGGV
jgi:protein-tyrosine-phosphatase